MSEAKMLTDGEIDEIAALRQERGLMPLDRLCAQAKAANALREALKNLIFAYTNKDGEFPHQFETDALAQAQALLGETR